MPRRQSRVSLKLRADPRVAAIFVFFHGSFSYEHTVSVFCQTTDASTQPMEKSSGSVTGSTRPLDRPLAHPSTQSINRCPETLDADGSRGRGAGEARGDVAEMGGLKGASFRPMKTNLSRAFYEGECGSSVGIEGTTRTHPNGGAHSGAFSLAQPSGLARAQQVFLAQKFLNLPAMPAYVKDEGGLVLDRVVANVGKGEWWSTLTCRVRAQRAWNTPQVQEGKAHRAILDPSMYALGGRFRTTFMQNVAVKAIGELASVKGVTRALAKKFKLKRAEEDKADEAGDDLCPRGRATIQAKIPGHVLSMDLSHNERFQTTDGYIDGPTSASINFATRGRGALNYRVGARKWLGPNVAPFEPMHGGGLTKPPMKELQAGVSYEKQVVLWRGRRRRKKDSTQAQSGYTAMPQVPTLTVGGIYGAIWRKSLDEKYQNGKEVSLQNFGSVGVHAQLGSFSRPLFDFTAIDLRLDAGAMGSPNRQLNTEEQKPMSLTDRLMTMDGRLKSNLASVTLSLSQQLIGPLRLRAEVRASGEEALNATRAGISALKERKTTQEIRGAVQKQFVSPEVVYGIDCALAPTVGSARVVAWYNATRQEGFAELRLFDL